MQKKRPSTLKITIQCFSISFFRFICHPAAWKNCAPSTLGNSSIFVNTRFQPCRNSRRINNGFIAEGLAFSCHAHSYAARCQLALWYWVTLNLFFRDNRGQKLKLTFY